MISTLTLAACGNNEEKPAADPGLQSLAPAGWTDAAGEFVNRQNEPAGFVVLSDAPAGGVLMRVDLNGLSEGWHGIHLHQIADCSDYEDGFKASGGHVDPDDRAHGLMNEAGPERADLTNIYAGADGRATAELFNGRVSLRPSEAAAAVGAHTLIDEGGFAIIIHQDADDHETQPIGGAGGRVACAAINARL